MSIDEESKLKTGNAIEYGNSRASKQNNRKNNLYGINVRLRKTEEGICELEDRVIEITQSAEQRLKMIRFFITYQENYA